MALDPVPGGRAYPGDVIGGPVCRAAPEEIQIMRACNEGENSRLIAGWAVAHFGMARATTHAARARGNSGIADSGFYLVLGASPGPRGPGDDTDNGCGACM